MVFTNYLEMPSYCECCGGDCLVSLGNATDHDNYCMRCYMRRSATSQYDEKVCAKDEIGSSRSYLHGDVPKEENLQSTSPKESTSLASGYSTADA